MYYPFGTLADVPTPFYVYDVKNFGALGNGVADDTAAIQAAVSACGAAGGGYVFIPLGVYMTNTSVWVPSNVNVFGAGRDVSIVKCMSSFITSQAVFQSGPSVGVPYYPTARGKNVTLRDLTCDLSLASAASQAYGISLGHTDYMRVVNVRVYNSPGYGIYMGSTASTSTANNSINPIVAYCLLDTCGRFGNSDSIGGGNTTDELMIGNQFIGCYGTAMDRVNPYRATWAYNKSSAPSTVRQGGLKTDCGAVDLLIIGNELDGGQCFIGGFLANAPGLFGPPSGVRIIGNLFKNSPGLAIQAGNQTNTSTSVSTDNVIADNVFENIYDICVGLTDVKNTTIEGNVFNQWNTQAAGGHTQYAVSISAVGDITTGSQGIRTNNNVFKSTTSNVPIYEEYQQPSAVGLPYNNDFSSNTIIAPGTPTIALWTANLPQTTARNNRGLAPISTGWSTPAVPASTGNVVNQTPYDQWVVLAGFTALTVNVNGTNIATGVAALAFPLRAGSKLTLTYTGGAGTMVWAPL